MGYIIYFNVVESKEIINSPYNPRLDSMADRVVRGNIADKDGNILATTETDGEGNEYRSYPYGNLYAQVVGYSSQGKAGLESSQNFELLTSNAFVLEKLKREFQDKKNQGDNVVTTLDTSLQQAAYNAMGDNKGAVVVMEPSTGKILAMLSKPDFDPNTVAQNWDSLSSDEDSRLLNRATQGLYAPGSTFKIVTALAYMRENGGNTSGYNYTCNGSITYEGTTIPCLNHQVHGNVDMAGAFAYSCNAAFCDIGLKLNVSDYQKTAKDLLFNSKLPGDVTSGKSQFVLKKSDPSSERMMTAMGQGKTLMSPYHMALITSAVANGGILMKPYVVDQITNYTGSVIKETAPEKYKELMSSAEASQLKAYMEGVVDYGTGTALSGQGYTVAGKTGTAEYSSDNPSKNHSWFTGFSNTDNPELVVSVIVEGSDGNTRAVNVAKQILDSYYYN